MRINEHIMVSTSKISLLPYSKHHVPIYHEWMKDPDIQAATASEPLSLTDEYSMQQSWRNDSDKLTFILCLPPGGTISAFGRNQELKSMIGDINMFISIREEDDETLSLIGEVEVMVAMKECQGQGYGRAALLAFAHYVLLHEKEILQDFPGLSSQSLKSGSLDYFVAKINQTNGRSLNLFEAVGFQRTSRAPNFFGEYELRNSGWDSNTTAAQMEKYGISKYQEIQYSAED